MRLIINADDFGYSRAVNYGIIDCFTKGVLTSTTMMMNMPDTSHAVSLAQENKGLGVGVHLVLTAGKPLSNHVPTLVNETGFFKDKQQILTLDSIDDSDIEREWRAQIEKCLAYQLKPTHLDSHHFVHAHPNISPIIFKLATEYDLPVRNDFGLEKPRHITTTDIFIKSFFGETASLQAIFDLVQHTNKTVELMCHPGYIDHQLLKQSSYSLERAKEVEILTSFELRNWVAENKIKLMNYQHIR